MWNSGNHDNQEDSHLNGDDSDQKNDPDDDT